MDNTQRGYIEVPIKLVRDEPNMLIMIQADMAIVEATTDYVKDKVKFIGYSSQFERRDPYQQALAYDWFIGNEGKVTYKRRG